MICYKTGNMFESDSDCLFNAVNCEGIMGKGIAYQFKMRFPENNKKYVEACNTGDLRPGKLFIFRENGKTIVNFPTKDKWREPSRMKYITDGLDAFVQMLPELNITQAAIPPLGCGNGGLNWEEVKIEIETKLKDINANVVLYEPIVKKHAMDTVEQMTVNELLLLHVKKSLEKASSLRFQKTIFFANYYYGKDIYRFSRGRYGPYSKELFHTAERIGGYQKRNGLKDSNETYQAIYQVICSKRVDAQFIKLSDAADRSIKIVNSIENDSLLEGAATALYLIKDEKIVRQDEILKSFKEWSEDKADRFNEGAILYSLDYLEQLGIVQKNLFQEYELLRHKHRQETKGGRM